MSQLVLDRVLPVMAPLATPAAPAPRSRPSIDIAHPDDRHAASAGPVAFRPTSAVGLALAAARADTVHLAFSAEVPTVAAMREVVRQLEAEITAVGRDRASVRVVLDLEVVPAPDPEVARRKRSHLEHLDALAGLTWSPAATRVVATPSDALDTALDLAGRVRVDGVVLVPLAEGRAADELRALALHAAH